VVSQLLLGEAFELDVLPLERCGLVCLLLKLILQYTKSTMNPTITKWLQRQAKYEEGSIGDGTTLPAVRFRPVFTKSTAPVGHSLKSTLVVWATKCSELGVSPLERCGLVCLLIKILVYYCQTTSASTAPCISRRMCCPTHSASHCATCQPLFRAFSG